MTQKERSLLVLKALVLTESKIIKPKDKHLISTDYIIGKIDGCMDLMRPEVLLSAEAEKEYIRLVNQAKAKGKII
jgi:hypothetical protein